MVRTVFAVSLALGMVLGGAPAAEASTLSYRARVVLDLRGYTNSYDIHVRKRGGRWHRPSYDFTFNHLIKCVQERRSGRWRTVGCFKRQGLEGIIKASPRFTRRMKIPKQAFNYRGNVYKFKKRAFSRNIPPAPVGYQHD